MQWGQQQQQWGQQHSQQPQQRYERRVDLSSGRPFYYDTMTAQSTWAQPAEWQEPSVGVGAANYGYGQGQGQGQAAAEDDDSSWD